MSTDILTEPLLTAEQFSRRPDPGYPEELAKGRVECLPIVGARHGQICAQVAILLGQFLHGRELGHLIINNSGVITERDPDTVRGPDIAYYSFERLPKGPVPASCGPEIPELVVEVRSPHDAWPKLLAKVAEYLDAGTTVVIVLDDDRKMAHVYAADGMTRLLSAGEELTLPEVFPDFRASVSRSFE